MAGSEAMLEKMQLRQSYRNVWHTDLTNAVTADLPWGAACRCGVAHACPICCEDAPSTMTCQDMSAAPGTCRAVASVVRAGAQRFALQLRSSAVSAVQSPPPGRFLLQDEFNIQTTQCDNCIISFMFLLQQLACICSLVVCIVGNSELSKAAHVISCMSHMVYWTVCSCMQTQHKGGAGREGRELRHNVSASSAADVAL